MRRNLRKHFLGRKIKVKLVLATHNKNKLKEVKNILGEKFEIVSLSEIGFFDEIEETGKTFSENALIKARAVYEFSSLPVIADDSGLCVDALCGAPGVYSARFSEMHGIKGEDTDKENVKLLLKKLEGAKDRSGKFVCAIAYIDEKGEHVFNGECKGVITETPVGNGGFGYDPVLFYEPFGKTLGEMESSEKNAISHRYNALLLLKKYLEEAFGDNV